MTPVRPDAPLADDDRLILCLGADYAHKNRLFALRCFDALQRRFGFDGKLVLAGPQVRCGSSREAEQGVIDRDPGLARRVTRLGGLSDGEKEWLLRRSVLILYPTVHEGFGFVPFEAAARGLPCLWAAGTSMSEVLPDDAAGIVPWDAIATAERAQRLIVDPEARAANVAAIAAAAAPLRWDETASRLLDVYGAVRHGSPSPAGVLERADALGHGGFSEDAVRLVGPGGALPRDVERPLLALLMRPALATPLLGVLRAGYRVAHRAGQQRMPSRARAKDY